MFKKIVLMSIICFSLFSVSADNNDQSVPPADPIVSAGEDRTYSTGETVNLTGTISETNCEYFNYQWEQITGPAVVINNSGATMINSKTYNPASFVFPETNDNIELKLNISPQSCVHGLNTYSDNVIYTKNSESVISETPKRRSWTSKMRDEAISIFKDPKKLEAVNLKLNLTPEENSTVMYFDWNYLGGEGEINYILEYSTQANFPTENLQTIETKSFPITFYKFYLNTNSLIHYFRLKAEYLGETSQYSNIIKYYSEDYLEVCCSVKTQKMINFSDVFLGYDFLIDEYLVPKCLKCKSSLK